MPTLQNTTDYNETVRSPGGSAMGVCEYSTSDSTTLKQIFFASPINTDTDPYSPEEVKKRFQEEVMRGSVKDGGYWTFEEPFNRNYIGKGESAQASYAYTPDEEVPPGYIDPQYGKIGDPINAFVPNTLASPDADPYKQPIPGELMVEHANNGARKGSAPFVGLGSNLSPWSYHSLSEKSKQGWWMGAEPMGSYVKGISPGSFVIKQVTPGS